MDKPEWFQRTVYGQARQLLSLTTTGTMTSHHACGMLVFLSVFLISYTPQCNGGSILVVPVDGSHWLNMKLLLEELHARGHNFTVIRTSRSWYIPEKSDLYTSITIEMALDYEQYLDVFLQEQIQVQRGRTIGFLQTHQGFNIYAFLWPFTLV